MSVSLDDNGNIVVASAGGGLPPNHPATDSNTAVGGGGTMVQQSGGSSGLGQPGVGGNLLTGSVVQQGGSGKAVDYRLVNMVAGLFVIWLLFGKKNLKTMIIKHF